MSNSSGYQSYRYKNIKDIKRTDDRVRILGIVVGESENNIIVDDSTGEIPISTENPEIFPKIVRVLGRVQNSENKLFIIPDIIQDMNNLDLKKFRQVYTDNKLL